MSEALALNNVNFNTKVKINKKEVIKVLEKRTEKAKLELLKKGLTDQGISFDESINDYHLFVKNIRESLKDVELSIANQLIENIDKEIDTMISELKKGSTTAFTNFVEKCNNILSPIKDSMVNSLAASGLITLTPTALGKLGVGVALTGISAYNILKNDKYKRVTNKQYELNRILQELETTKDKSGNYIDTRFNEQIQTAIRDFLKNNKIIYEDSGYLSLRDAIYNLSDDKKEELCKIINNLKGELINIDERLVDVNSSLLSRLKNKYVKPTAASLAGGVGIATAVNAIDPSLIAAPVNGTVLGKVIGSLSKSKVLGWLSGIAGSGLTFVSKYIPFLGNAAQKVLSLENIGLMAIGGAGIGLLGAIGKNIYRYLKKKKDDFNTQKDMKKLQELDFKLYGKDDVNEIKIIKEKMAKKDYDKEEIIINIVCEYMDELGIKYDKVPKNKEELESIIKGLSNKDKRSVYVLFSSLEEYLHREPNKFKRGIKKIGRFIKTTATLGLASVPVMELLGAGALVTNIKTKLFGDRFKMPNRIAEFNDTVGVNAYESANQKTNLKPQAGPSPRPIETPKPTITNNSQADFNSLSGGKPSVVRPSNITQSIYHTLPKQVFDINTILYGQTTLEDGINILSNMPSEELYSVFTNAKDISFATKLMEKLPEDAFNNLRTFMETSEKIDRSKTSYLFLKENMKTVIKHKNSLIEGLIKKIEASRRKEETIKKATEYFNVPLVAMANYNNQKRKG